MISMTIQGAREIEAKLRALPTKIAKKTVRQAVRAGCKVILPKAQENARGMADWAGGDLGSAMAKALHIRAAKQQPRGTYRLMILFRRDIGRFVYMTAKGIRYYVPAAVEYGHARPGAGGSGAKDVPARPIVRNAFETTKEKAVKVVETDLARGIERAVIEG